MRGWRWDAGRLVEVPFTHAVLRIADPLLFATGKLGPVPERLRDPQVHMPGLLREAALPGGPPVWFKPNHARRRRWFLWQQRPKSAWHAPVDPREMMTKITTLRGHRVGYSWPCGCGRWECQFAHQPRREEALIYLPGDTEPAEDDRDAVAYAMGWTERWPRWLRERADRELGEELSALYRSETGHALVAKYRARGVLPSGPGR